MIQTQGGGSPSALYSFLLFGPVPAHQIVQTDIIEVCELDQLLDGDVDLAALVVRICVPLDVQISGKLELLFIMIFPQF